MFTIFNAQHSYSGAKPGLRQFYSDEAIRFFSPPAFLASYAEQETDLYIVQAYGRIVDPPASSSLDPVNIATQLLDVICAGINNGNFSSLARLNGTFCATVYEKEARRLHVVSDRYGTVRTFIGVKDGVIYIFPRAHFFRDLNFAFLLDRALVTELLVFRYLVSERTFLHDVRLTPAGSVLSYSLTGSVQQHEYWSWRGLEDASQLQGVGALQSAEVGDLAAQMAALWQQSIDRRLGKCSEVTIPLSGGLDSRAILAAALECKEAKNLATITFGTPGSLDYEIPRMLARRVGIKNIRCPMPATLDFWEEWERNCEDSDGCIDSIDHFFTSHWRAAQDFTDQMVVGFMGGEITGAHLQKWMTDAGLYGRTDEHLLARFLLESQLAVSLHEVAPLVDLDVHEVRAILFPLIATLTFPGTPLTIANRCMYWDYQYRQRKFINPSVQKLQGELFFHLPFLDNDFVDFCLKMPFDARAGQKVYSRMLASTFSSLFSLPTSNFSGRSLVEALNPRSRKQWRERLTRCMPNLGPLKLRSLRRKLLGMGALPNTKFIDFPTALREHGAFSAALESALKKAERSGMIVPGVVSRYWSAHVTGGVDHSAALVAAANVGVVDCVFNP